MFSHSDTQKILSIAHNSWHGKSVLLGRSSKENKVCIDVDPGKIYRRVSWSGAKQKRKRKRKRERETITMCEALAALFLMLTSFRRAKSRWTFDMLSSYLPNDERKTTRCHSSNGIYRSVYCTVCFCWHLTLSFLYLHEIHVIYFFSICVYWA